jgi:hypothetical protein
MRKSVKEMWRKEAAKDIARKADGLRVGDSNTPGDYNEQSERDA